MTIQGRTDRAASLLEAIRDFAWRECGAREQRDALTEHGRAPHNPQIYSRVTAVGRFSLRVPLVLIRHAAALLDGDACADVYAPYVADGLASLEERPPSAQEMSDRIQRISAGYPWLVAERDGAVVGYAYGSAHHERSSYRWAVNVAVYIAATHHRRGVGTALYGALLPLLARQGLYVACAGVTLPNPGSVGLHEAMGFVPIGVYRSIGYKFGRWHDVGWWQLALHEPVPGQTPAEPGPPARLD